MAAEGAGEALQEGVLPVAGEHSTGVESVGRPAEAKQAHQALVHLVVGLRGLGEFGERLGLSDGGEQGGDVTDFHTDRGEERGGGRGRGKLARVTRGIYMNEVVIRERQKGKVYTTADSRKIGL